VRLTKALKQLKELISTIWLLLQSKLKIFLYKNKVIKIIKEENTKGRLLVI